jgi:hypothetical protein
MKQFIKKIFVFSGILFIIVVIINFIIWNISKQKNDLDFFYKYEDDTIVYKYDRYIKSNELKENDNVFIGSSATYRHLNPILFDSLLNKPNSTYNLAFSGFFPFRSLDFAQLIGEHKTIKPINFFIELRELPSVYKNFEADPILNSMSLEKYIIAMDFFRHQDLTISQKVIYYFGPYTLGIFMKYINLGYFSKPLKSSFAAQPFDKARGFFPFDYETGKDYQIMKNQFLKSPKVQHDTNIDSAKFKIFFKQNKDDKYLKYILSMANDLKMEGNKVIFFIPPRHGNPLVKCYEKVLQKNGFPVIDLADEIKYPELYKDEYSFDNTHLNLKGALFFTKYFAAEYQRITLGQSKK